MSSIAIYRHDLLPLSETFIREQSEHLDTFRAIYVGLRRVPGLHLPDEHVIVLNAGTLIGRLAELRLLATGSSPRLTNALGAFRPALIHAHFEGGGVAAKGIAHALRVPLVVTCHGYDVTMSDRVRWPNPLLRAEYGRRKRRLQREGDLFVAVSEHIKRHMIERGYPAQRIRVHYIGVDCGRLTPDPRITREPIVLFVGRLVEKKGCEYLIRAMGQVQVRCPGARLVIIGDGPLAAPLRILARDQGVRHVEFLGARSRDEVIDWMNRSWVLSVPTIRAANGDMDGCCMVFPEAHAMGLPVAAFNAGGTPEAVLHGKTGLLVEEGDDRALADAIVRLFAERDLWSAFSTSARAHAEARFNLAVQTRALEGIYRDLLQRRADRRYGESP